MSKKLLIEKVSWLDKKFMMKNTVGSILTELWSFVGQ